jgi:FKBP-type peptidyl-prolyl cis-trans isomerase
MESIIKKITKEGKGEVAKIGQKVTVHYTGKFLDGKVFDSSKLHGQPFSFNLGAGEVIKGWDDGVAGMKVGEICELTIPPELAYGKRGVGPIPPDSTLLFEVELLSV